MKTTDAPVTLDGDVTTLLTCHHTAEHRRDETLSLKRVADDRFSDAPDGVYLVLHETHITCTAVRFNGRHVAREAFERLRETIGHMSEPRAPR